MNSGFQIRPVVSAILQATRSSTKGRGWSKSPVVYTAGLLRTRGDRIETEDWIWLDAMAGQQLFYPPNVSGWNDDRWLDTSTFRARWLIARRALQKHAVEPRAREPERPAAEPTRRSSSTARSAGGARSQVSHAHPCRRSSTTPRRRWPPRSPTRTGSRTFPLMTYNALRHLAAVSPEMQTA